MAIWERCGDCHRVPSQSRYFSRICYCNRPLRLAVRSPALPKGEPRGGRCPPGCFPIGETTSAHCSDNGTIKLLQMQFGGAAGKSAQIRRRSRPWLPLWGSWHGVAVTERVPASNQRTFFIYATAPALSGSLFARQLSQRESQGAGVARPVVSPLGKQRRRIAPTMAPSNIIRQNWTVQW